MPIPTDRRAWVIHLTPDGKALIIRVFDGHQDVMERAMSGPSRAETDLEAARTTASK
jgi:DNA-binding MarR family transcriptional regulator